MRLPAQTTRPVQIHASQLPYLPGLPFNSQVLEILAMHVPTMLCSRRGPLYLRGGVWIPLPASYLVASLQTLCTRLPVDFADHDWLPDHLKLLPHNQLLQ